MIASKALAHDADRELFETIRFNSIQNIVCKLYVRDDVYHQTFSSRLCIWTGQVLNVCKLRQEVKLLKYKN